MKEKVTRFYVLDYLKTEQDIVEFIEVSCEEARDTGDRTVFFSALDVAAKARSINALAKQLGVSRESLYKDVQKRRKPSIETICKAAIAK